MSKGFYRTNSRRLSIVLLQLCSMQNAQLHKITINKEMLGCSIINSGDRSSMVRPHPVSISMTTTTLQPFNGLFFLGLPRWAGTRKVQPIWILLEQGTVSGSGISWAICKSALRSSQITMPAPHHSVFTGQMPFLPPNQQRQSTEGTKYFNE